MLKGVPCITASAVTTLAVSNIEKLRSNPVSGLEIMMFGMTFDAGRRSPVGFRPLAARRSETERELLARTSRENVRNVLEFRHTALEQRGNRSAQLLTVPSVLVWGCCHGDGVE